LILALQPLQPALQIRPRHRWPALSLPLRSLRHSLTRSSLRHSLTRSSLRLPLLR